MANIYNKRVLTNAYHPVQLGNDSAKYIAESAQKLGESSTQFAKALSDDKKVDYTGEQLIELGRKNFQDGLEIAGNQAMTELANNPAYSSNPTALSSEIDKVRDKMMSSVGNDEETQINIARNFELKKQPLITAAQNNFYKQQRETEVANTAGMQEDNIDTFSFAFDNILEGVQGEESVYNFYNLKSAQDNFYANLKKKDERGFYVFTPSQQIQMKRNWNKMIRNTVVNKINSLPYNQKKQVVDDIVAGKYDVITGIIDQNEQGGEIQTGNMADAYMDTTNAQYIKAYAKRLQNGYKKANSQKTGMSDIEYMDQQARFSLNDLEMTEKFKQIDDLKDGEDKAYSLMDYRKGLVDLLKSGNLDEKDFKKLTEKTILPLINNIKSVKPNWFDNQAFPDALEVINTLPDIKDNNEVKAALYSRLYDTMRKENIVLDSDDDADIKRAKDIALRIKNEYVEKQVPGVYGNQQVVRVLSNADTLYAYHQEKVQPTPVQEKNYQVIRRKSDGAEYKLFTGSDGKQWRERIK